MNAKQNIKEPETKTEAETSGRFLSRKERFDLMTLLNNDEMRDKMSKFDRHQALEHMQATGWPNLKMTQLKTVADDLEIEFLKSYRTRGPSIHEQRVQHIESQMMYLAETIRVLHPEAKFQRLDDIASGKDRFEMPEK